MSYKNNQPLMVANKWNVDTGRMIADPANPLTDKYGDQRDVVQGRSLIGDGVMYISLIGLLATDTYTVGEGSDNITLTNDRIDIVSADEVYGISIFRGSTLIGTYRCEEENGVVLINTDTSSTLPNATLVNSTALNFGTQNINSYANNSGYTLSDGATYYYDVALTQLIPINVIIPRDESNHLKCCAYITGGVQADLQYKGENPYYIECRDSGCFKSDGNSYVYLGDVTDLEVDNFEFGCSFIGLADGFVRYIYTCQQGWYVQKTALNKIAVLYVGSGGVAIYVLGSVTLIEGEKYDVYLKKYGATLIIKVGDVSESFTVDNTIIYTNGTAIGVRYRATPSNHYRRKIWNCYHNELDASGHFVKQLFSHPLPNREVDGTTYYDVSGNSRDAVLINGLSTSHETQDYFHYLQDKGFRLSSGVRIPALEDGTAAADGDPLTHIQDGYRLLNSGNTWTLPLAPALIQADIGNKYYLSEVPIKKDFDSFAVDNLYNDQHFNDVSNAEFIPQSRYHEPNNFASAEQVNTEKKITNN